MKTYLLLVLVVVGSVFVSCSKEEEASEKPNEPNDEVQAMEIHSSWSLIQFYNGFGQPQSFEMGDVIWEINPDNTIEVVINTETEINQHIPFNEEGIHEYELLQDTVILHRDIYDHEFDYHFENDHKKLILSDNPEADGPQLIFER